MVEKFALAVLGSGSGNVVIPDDVGWGQSCPHRVKRFRGDLCQSGLHPDQDVRLHGGPRDAGPRASRFGLDARLERVDWPAIRDRVIARVDKTSLAGRKERAESTNCTVFEGHARFAGPHELVINDTTRIEAEQIVIATGGRPEIPPVVENAGIEFHTSDTILRLDTLPASMVILGGGYIAVELAHVFSSFGVDIHIVEMAATLMETLDAEISKRFTDLNAKRWDVHLDATVTDVRTDEDGVVLVLKDGTRVTGELLLVVTGRRPNTDDLGLDVAGISLATTGTLSSTTSGGRHRVSGRWATAALRSSSSTWRMPKPELSPTTWLILTISVRSPTTGCPRRSSATRKSRRSAPDPRTSRIDSSSNPPRSTLTPRMGGPFRTTAVSASFTRTPKPARSWERTSLATKPRCSSPR